MNQQENIRRILKEETSPVSNEKLVQIFHNLFIKKGYLNFNGINLQPKLVNDGEYILFDVENPNDLSYSQLAIKDYIDDKFNDFIKLIDLNRFKIKFNSGEKFKIKAPEEFYINKTDYNNIRERIVNVKKFRCKFHRNQVELIGDVKLGSKFWIKVWGNEFNITVNAKLTNFKLDYGDKIEELSNDELDNFLHDGSNGDRYVDYIQDDLYGDALNYVWEHPTIYNQDNMHLNIDLV